MALINCKKIYEDKTKIISQNPFNGDQVYVYNKDFIIKDNGSVSCHIDKKGIFATITTCNVFRYLNSINIATYYISDHDSKTFIARKVNVIPIKINARRIAFGSYFLKRNPEIKSGEIFKEPIVEFFFEDGKKGHLCMIWEGREQCFNLYDLQGPVSDEGLIRKIYLQDIKGLNQMTRPYSIKEIARNVFLALERIWSKFNVVLVDLEIKCGIDEETGEVLVIDVIDNDSWCIWPKGNSKLMKGKEVFNEMAKITALGEEKIKKDYQWVADMSVKFR